MLVSIALGLSPVLLIQILSQWALAQLSRTIVALHIQNILEQFYRDIKKINNLTQIKIFEYIKSNSHNTEYKIPLMKT